MRTISGKSLRSLAGDRRDEETSAEGKGESYFWLLSRKSNLRSLTPKELQMHGRQHTGVSIYEARTETGEKDERNGRSDDGARGWQQKRQTMEEREREKVREKRNTDARERGRN